MKRVLVVDDEPTVRALICAGLEAFDLEVTAVAGGDGPVQANHAGTICRYYS